MATGLTLVKKFTYRGDTQEEFSNTYWFTGSTPADAAAWLALMNALVNVEKPLFPSTTHIVRAYGHDDPDPHAANVYANHFDDSPSAPVAGTWVPTDHNALAGAGDSASWIRWATGRTTEKGKRIYLRKYYHPGWTGLSGGDTMIASYVTALDAVGDKLSDGTFLDGRTITGAGHTDTVTASTSSPFLTTRTLKRRGKRPSPSAP